MASRETSEYRPNTRVSISSWSAFPVGSGGDEVLVGAACVERHLLYAGKTKRKLTDGWRDYSADLSPSGELLVSKWGPTGRFHLAAGGPTEARATDPRTAGHRAGVFPATGASGPIRLRHEERDALLGDDRRVPRLTEGRILSHGAAFSPDGRSIAYRERNGLPEGHDHFCGRRACAQLLGRPVSMRSSLVDNDDDLVPRGGAGRYYWSERIQISGEKTGSRLEVSAENMAVGEVQCGSTSANSPVFQPLRIEKDEISKLLVAR